MDHELRQDDLDRQATRWEIAAIERRQRQHRRAWFWARWRHRLVVLIDAALGAAALAAVVLAVAYLLLK